MNSYYDDEPPYPSQGRARVPGAGGHGPGDGYEPAAPEDFDPFAQPQGPSYPNSYEDPYADPYAAPPPPAPPVPPGRATVGRASVRPAGGYDEQAPAAAYDSGLNDGFDPFSSGDPYASGPPRPSDPYSGDPHSSDPFNDPYPSDGPAQSMGRASVSPTSPAAGRASVGRATVGTPGGPAGPGGPGGPGGPTGPRGRGTGPTGPGGKKTSKQARRRNRILAAFASLIMLSGLLVVVVTYYATTIQTPDSLTLPQSTTIDYSNGKPMAQIGQVTRETVPLSKIPKGVQDAVVATEDATFYTNIGVDVKGIARAFVNNVTGGNTQGASTITQQYARSVANLTYSTSYTRKAREIIIAIKLTQKYSKSDILYDYLNTVLFGRGAYGIQAAAKAYFGKNVEDLTQSEGMVLAGLIKDPEDNIYDPACKCLSATQRWEYTRKQLVDNKFITAAQASALKYPTTWIPPKATGANQGMDGPQGFIVHHVMDELTQMKKADGSPVFPANGPNSLINGGYTIKTTISQSAQADAVAAASTGSGKPFNTVYGVDSKGKKVKTVADSLVAVEPGTGRVIAYYGGPNGSNLDFGGIYNDPVMAKSAGLTGQHIIPGSTFKTITMATALSQDYALDSLWWGPQSRTFKGRATPITNSAADECPGAHQICPMWQALQHSTNTVFYSIGQKVGPAKVIDMAQALGINHIWSDSRCGGKRIDLTPKDGDQVYPKCVGGEVAFGQFGVTVQDVANVMATFAAHGDKATEHFVESVTQGYQKTPIVRERIVQAQVPGVTAAMMDDQSWAMQQLFNNRDEASNFLDGDRPAAVKTGTWQLDDTSFGSTQTSNAMYSGFIGGTPEQGQIAASAWVGYSVSPVAVKYVTSTNKVSNLSGANVPAKIWKTFMDAYEKGKPIQQFNKEAHTGNPLAGETTKPTAPPAAPPAPPGAPPCPNPQGCGPTSPQTPGPPAPSSLTASVNKQGQPNSVSVSWDNSGGGPGQGQGQVQISWGDGVTNNGNEAGQKQHTYNQPGNYTITVTDADDPSRTKSMAVSVP